MKSAARLPGHALVPEAADRLLHDSDPTAGSPSTLNLERRTLYRLHNLSVWLLALYLALGPVAWLPGIPEGPMSLLKLVLAVLAVAVVLGTVLATGRRPFPPGILGPIGFLVLLGAWLPGLAEASSMSDSAAFLLGAGINFTIFWSAYCLGEDSDIVKRVFVRTFVVICSIVGIYLLGGDIWNEWPGSTHRGFGSSYASWSLALSLFLPLAIVAYVLASAPDEKTSMHEGPMHEEPRRIWIHRSLILGGALILLLAQFTSTGRSGLLLSLVVIGAVMLALLFRGPRLLIGIVVVLAILVWSVCGDGSCKDWLGIDQTLAWSQPVEAICKVDDLSTGRLSGIRIGAEAVSESSIFGHGLKQAQVLDPQGNPTQIHNLWLRWTLDGGLLPPLVLLVMAVRILQSALRCRRGTSLTESDRIICSALLLVVVTGLLVSLWEPGIPFGNRSTVIWWAAAGALAGIEARSAGSPPDGLEPGPSTALHHV